MILGDKYGLKFTWKIIDSVIWVVAPQVTVQYRWKTIQKGHRDLVKGDRFKQVKNCGNLGEKNWGLW